MSVGISLALGAGGARGLAHVHALRGFDDLGVRPVAVAGTSIGAVLGACYCAGMTGAKIEEHLRARVLDRGRLIADFLKVRPASFGSFLADGGPRLGELNLETILSVYLPAQVPTAFDALSIPFTAVATDYYAGVPVRFRAGDLRRAIAASAAIPAVFLPVNVEGRYHIDGSVTEPCPIEALQAGGPVIAVDVSGGPIGEQDVRPRKVDAVYGANQIMLRSMARLAANAYGDTVLLRPKVEGYRPLDFLDAAEILAASAGLREETKAAIGRVLERPPPP